MPDACGTSVYTAAQQPLFSFTSVCHQVMTVMTPITSMISMSFSEGLVAPLYMHTANYPAMCGLHLSL